MKWKTILSPTYYWFMWFALCLIGYQYIQDTIRPNYSGENAAISYLLGVAPNYLANLGLPSFFIIVIQHLKFRRDFTPWEKALYSVAFSTAGLVAWEIIQVYTSRGFFDWHDILWTFLGGLTFLAIWRVSPKP